MRYLLDKKDSLVLDKICKLFGFGEVTLMSGTNKVYRYTVTGFKPLNEVISYFKLFPLQNNKALSF